MIMIIATAAFLLILLAGLAWTLRQSGRSDADAARLAALGETAALTELRGRLRSLAALPALFRDNDYGWLREQGSPEAARRLRRDRVRLARRYLLELRQTFELAHALHERLSPGAETDRTAAAALRFRLRWTAAYLLLPLNLWQLRLSGLASFGEEIAASLRALDRPAVSAPA